MKYKIFIYTTHMAVYATNCDWLSCKLEYISGLRKNKTITGFYDFDSTSLFLYW
jgi:hypothetical protein